ncbi:hypothetical protein PFHG_00072 [Plasmodium falciparum HB3]|uniref:Uncharacterized protein n=1 Tax=Plasmodium falciparum (isolate HB3) TaxID=137071 RepID=A0A0L7K5I2_PLAFX|nr:hypothetical protein PFHG_00072 [Plasmodium falciparum HB3]
MKLKSYYFYIDIILLIFILYLKRCCKGYVLNVNVVDKDDLFVFLYKNEHLLASSYYNLKPSYFFSFDEGEININMSIHFKENTYIKKRNISQEVQAKYPLDEGIIKKTIKIEQKNRYMLVLINNNKLRITLKGNVVFYDYKTKHLSYDFLFIPDVLYFTSIVLLILVIIISLYFLRYREKSDIFMVLNMIFFLLSTYLNYKNINFIKDMGYMYMYYWISANILKKMQEIARLAEENLSFHVAELYKKYDIYKKYRLIFFAVILKPILLIIYKVLCLSPSNIDLYSSHEFLYIFFDINFDIIVYVLLFILFRTVEPIKFLKHILSNENFHID